MRERIIVEPPTSEARRDRVERQLFAQLAAVRAAERADSVIPTPRKSRSAFALAGLAAAAVALFLLITRDGERGGSIVSPSRVVTPVGGASQFTIGDAVIDAKSDTSVEWHVASDGSIILKLARGTVDCDVPHRPNRPAFRVITGDVTVSVVGTRFSVTATPSARVDVARGTVRVEAPGGTWLVEAGESWTPRTHTAKTEPSAEPVPGSAPELETESPSDLAEIEMEPVRVSRTKKNTGDAADSAPGRESKTAERTSVSDDRASIPPPTSRELAKEAYRVANRLEATEPDRAVAMYRAIAISDRAGGWAATALISLAELQIKLGRPAEALATIDDHQKRFPAAPTREDAAWFRIEAFRAMGKRDEARGAASDYLRQFPDGVYARPAARLTK